MSDLPPFVGPVLEGMAVYELTCRYTPTADDPTICAQRATTHLRMPGVYAEGYEIATSACDEHAPWARFVGFIDEHATTGSACAMPGAIWMNGPPSLCVLDDSGAEPELIETRELEMAR